MRFKTKNLSSDSTLVSDVLPQFLICRSRRRSQQSTVVLSKYCSAWFDNWFQDSRIVGELNLGLQFVVMNVHMRTWRNEEQMARMTLVADELAAETWGGVYIQQGSEDNCTQVQIIRAGQTDNHRKWSGSRCDNLYLLHMPEKGLFCLLGLSHIHQIKITRFKIHFRC